MAVESFQAHGLGFRKALGFIHLFSGIEPFLVIDTCTISTQADQTLALVSGHVTRHRSLERPMALALQVKGHKI